MACWTQLNLDEKTEIKTEALSSSFFYLIKNHDHAGIALFCGNIVIGCDSLTYSQLLNCRYLYY